MTIYDHDNTGLIVLGAPAITCQNFSLSTSDAYFIPGSGSWMVYRKQTWSPCRPTSVSVRLGHRGDQPHVRSSSHYESRRRRRKAPVPWRSSHPLFLLDDNLSSVYCQQKLQFRVVDKSMSYLTNTVTNTLIVAFSNKLQPAVMTTL